MPSMKNKNATIGSQYVAENIKTFINILTMHPPPADINSSENIEFHIPKLVQSFRGRDAELTQLATWFLQENTPPMVVICGLPGYGKTELAKHFTRLCRDHKLVQNILWINSETLDNLEHSFRELLKWLGERSDLDINSVVQRVHQRFGAKSSMFVFDNARDRQSIRDFVPNSEALCLVTSHVKDWGDDVPSLELAPLTSSGALAVLRAVLQHRFQTEHEALYEMLSATLGCVPLALQVAAAYVRQDMRDLGKAFNLREYVQGLQHSCDHFIKEAIPEFSANPYTISIYQAVRKSLIKIDNISNKLSELALNILHICAYLNPDQIFLSDLIKFSYIQQYLLSNSGDLNRAISILSNHSFINVVENQIFIHRLTQDTLSLYQIHLIKKDHNYYYFACLEYLLFNIDTSHRYFILKSAEKHIVTFLYFYSNCKSDIILKNTFLNHLIATGCEIFLKEIFDELRPLGAGIINAHNLLHEAVRCGQYGALELLLAHGGAVDAQNALGNTPLSVAADLLDLRAVDILTAHKADVNAINSKGEFVLHRVIAALRRPQHVAKLEEACKMLQWLAKNGANTVALDLQGGTLLHTASWVLNAELIQFLVCEFQLDVNALDHNNQTPLYHVSKGCSVNKGRRLRTAECLLNLGARLDVLDKWNQTPAQHARSIYCDYLAEYFENPSTEYIKNYTCSVADVLICLVSTGETMLLSRKLDELGESAAEKIDEYCLLHEAVRHGQLDVLKLLLAYGAHIDNKDDKNDTALLVAARELDLLAVQELARRGADVNAANTAGRSVLHALVAALGRARHAYRQEEVCEVLRWLVKHGANTHVVTQDGQSLLHYAAYALLSDVIHFLIREYHLNVDAVDADGQTPLFYITYGLEYWYAEESRGICTATWLKMHGASLHIVDLNGLTPVEYAWNRGFNNLAEDLKTPTNHPPDTNTETEDTNKELTTPSTGNNAQQPPDTKTKTENTNKELIKPSTGNNVQQPQNTNTDTKTQTTNALITHPTGEISNKKAETSWRRLRAACIGAICTCRHRRREYILSVV